VGGAVAVLSAQVEDLTKTLSAAQSTALVSAETLSDLTVRAEEMSKRLDLQMASLHDIPEPAVTPQKPDKLVDSPSTTQPMFMRRAGGGNQ